MIDRDLAGLQETETKVLNLAVKRNIKRFPRDFMFQLSKEEFEDLRFQIETSKGRGGTRYLPDAFTEQGTAMFEAAGKKMEILSIHVSRRPNECAFF